MLRRSQLSRKIRLLLASLLSFGWLLAIPAAQAATGLHLNAYICSWGYNESPPEGCNTNAQYLGVVPYIDFNDGSSGPLGASEDYQYNWTGYFKQTLNQSLQFRVCSDDGMRLYLNNQLIVNNWYDRGGQCGVPVSYTMQNHDWVPISVWFYENGGGSNGSLQWNLGSEWEIIPSSVFSTEYISPVVKTIGPPRNLSVSDSGTSIVLTWDAPDTGNTFPERYAINFSTAAGGWGIATGNVGGANALNTTITVSKSMFESLQPPGTSWTFSVRSDNDTNSLYSEISNQVILTVGQAYVPASLPFAYQYRLDENAQLSIDAPSGKMIETITAWYGDPNDGNYGELVTDTLTALNSGKTSTVISATNDVFGDPVPGVGKILIFNISYVDLPGPTPEEIAAQQEVESETARQNQANASVSTYESATITSLSDYNPITALKDAAQSLVNLVKDLVAKAGFQSRIDYKSSAINTVKAKLEADQAAAIAEAARIEAERLAAAEQARLEAEAKAKAEAEAARIEAERLAAIAAAQAAAAEQARLEAEAKAKAEAEAKAKAEEEEKARIEAEEKAKAEAEEKARIEAEEKAKEEAEAKAKAEAEEKARIEAEEKAKAEAEEKERLEAEAKAKAEEEEKARIEAEAKAKEEAEAKAEEERIRAEEEAESKAEEEKKKAEEESKKELEEAIKDAKDGKELTEEQKEAVVESLLENVKPGEAITAAAIAASGVFYSDLPPETPVELRTDTNGNEVVITAEVAAQVELITDPGAFAQELFSDPGAALAALGSIGADMSDEERKESTEAVVATVVAAGAAINAVAAAGGSAPSGGSTGGGNSGGSGNGSTGSRRNGKW
jgi:hypothetical protein